MADVAKILSYENLALALGKLKGWTEIEGEDAMRKVFTFRDFDMAFSFMMRVAEHARSLNHHPTWINSFNKVDIVLTTHDVGGISTLDVRLAHLIEEAAQQSLEQGSRG